MENQLNMREIPSQYVRKGMFFLSSGVFNRKHNLVFPTGLRKNFQGLLKLFFSKLKLQSING